ncbi:hypothetical protein BACFIN_08661 [Bacteroides finegoldii DSM 17565]|nr:hypothetical protein BACFIN_08661 [Bacteroides finegoldii DSM 17565]
MGKDFPVDIVMLTRMNEIKKDLHLFSVSTCLSELAGEGQSFHLLFHLP